MSFRMKLASLPADAATYEALRFHVDGVDPHGQVVRRVDRVLGTLVGDELDYGALFAYLFRRFGFPNAPWDAGRLARYVLATPCADMFLVIEPRLSGTATEVFGFHAPKAVGVAAAAYSGSRLPCSPEDWDGADPLKPYAMAAAKTLKGLLRPVCLESDGAIDIFGAVPRTRRALHPAPWAQPAVLSRT